MWVACVVDASVLSRSCERSLSAAWATRPGTCRGLGRRNRRGRRNSDQAGTTTNEMDKSLCYCVVRVWSVCVGVSRLVAAAGFGPEVRRSAVSHELSRSERGRPSRQQNEGDGASAEASERHSTSLAHSSHCLLDAALIVLRPAALTSQWSSSCCIEHRRDSSSSPIRGAPPAARTTNSARHQWHLIDENSALTHLAWCPSSRSCSSAEIRSERTRHPASDEGAPLAASPPTRIQRRTSSR